LWFFGIILVRIILKIGQRLTVVSSCLNKRKTMNKGTKAQGHKVTRAQRHKDKKAKKF